ncbi:hypothetical protein HPB50_012491 [Hyalomma asiaticum]|uniref:Uncharacterized protein n=1 Tax=Hyalomma asiaticum TaxID=266040 RepID=A0ACB7SF00_HYAAI|nr:hypothetical protein HPB50_012491 [Hyalomma asiaticum]
MSYDGGGCTTNGCCRRSSSGAEARSDKAAWGEIAFRGQVRNRSAGSAQEREGHIAAAAAFTVAGAAGQRMNETGN